VKIYCADSSILFGSASVNDTNTCNPIITFSSYVGCSTSSINAFWDWINSNKWVMFTFFVAIGFFVCFFGRLLFKPVMFLAGIIATVTLVWILFYSTFLSDNNEAWVGWTVLAVAVVLGLIVGFCLMKIVKLGAFILAAWGGFSLALLTYNSFFYLTMS
jgi:hypothetical protein